MDVSIQIVQYEGKAMVGNPPIHRSTLPVPYLWWEKISRTVRMVARPGRFRTYVWEAGQN